MSFRISGGEKGLLHERHKKYRIVAMNGLLPLKAQFDSDPAKGRHT